MERGGGVSNPGDRTTYIHLPSLAIGHGFAQPFILTMKPIYVNLLSLRHSE